ncbi:MAG: glycosyltransferase family 2 protein [Parcubacteria group bacterium]
MTISYPDKVAVIIAAKDAEATIGRAVRSALAQPEAAEVIVIDDASTDSTSSAATAADDGTGRLSVRRLDRNVGPAGARNIAWEMTSSPLLTVLDADDSFLPGRLGRLSAKLEDNDFVADDLIQTEDPETGPSRELLAGSLPLPRTLDFAEFVLGNIGRAGRIRRELGFLKPLVRSEFLDRHGLRYEPTLRLGEDFILYASALARGAKFRLVESCGYISLVRPSSLSASHDTADLQRLLRAADRLRAEPLGPREALALARYRRALADKVHHREVLDEKRARGWPAGLAKLFSRPGSVPHVVLHTLVRPRHAVN